MTEGARINFPAVKDVISFKNNLMKIKNTSIATLDSEEIESGVKHESAYDLLI